MVFAIVLIGGITRLTGSGLSMVEWRPLMGAVPPLTDADWTAVFERYQQSPQYALVNDWMTLADFKRIFFWEFLHRLFGRLIGLAFLVPWVYFLLRRRLTGSLAARTGVAFVLGGLQGLLGWYMVKSGLVDVPAVSHYRLAAHLLLALIVANWLLWILLGLWRAPTGHSKLRAAAWVFVAAVGLQIIYGAFTAGTRAGLLFSTFPDMDGAMVPSGMGVLGVRDLLDNPVTIHFIHRMLAWALAVGAVILFVAGRRQPQPMLRHAVALVLGLVGLQVILGAATVVLDVATWIAVIHQGVGFLVLSAAVFAAYAAGGAST